jgi:hypothetical protein
MLTLIISSYVILSGCFKSTKKAMEKILASEGTIIGEKPLVKLYKI